MYVKYLINQYNLATGLSDSLIAGGNMFDQNTSSGDTQEYATIANKEFVIDHTKIAQDKIHGPLAFPLRILHLTEFDTVELTNENYAIHIIGNCLVGNFTTVEMPIWKHENITIIGDLFSCVLMSALYSNLQLATAYLRSAQLLMSINRKDPLEYIQANELSKERQISLNRFE